MNYLEWNNLIANHFFNLDNAGKNIHLFITKQEIINLGRGNFNEETDEEIWADFLRKLKNGLPGSSCFPNIFDKALYAFQQWKKPGIKSIEGVEVKYPLYISYLVFTVLPLIEIQGDYNSNNYFDRLADFLTENNIDQNLKGKLRYIDCLWNDLSFWANECKNGGIGLFNTVVFKHTTWKFVGKPFSQCVIPPKAIKKLPEFFSCSGLTPNSFYQDDIFKNRLIRNGLSILGLKPSVIELIKKGNKDEIGQSIIETVKTEFSKWTGEEHETILKDGIAKTIRRKTVVPLKLQFKINEDGELDFSFRAKYLTEPPPGLRFEEFEDIYENENWSRTLCRPYKESFELRDVTNKWIAKFEFRNIRLFVRGGYYLLSNDFWIETESLSRVEGIFLLCKNSIKDSIKEWCENSCREFKDYSTLLNLPSGNSLFWIKDPQSSHDQFQQLRVYKDKAITLRTGTGLKIGYRTYLKDMLPEIEIINADGKETVYLQYETSEEKTKLIKHQNLGGIWLLPNTLLLNSSFFIQIENEFIDGYRQTYKVDEVSLKDLSNDFLPKRNKYNDLIEDSTEYIQGNNIQNSRTINTIVDGQSFSPNISAMIQQAPILKFEDNLLLKWLVGIKECGITEFHEAFETVLHKSFTGEQIKIQERRKYSINILDHLGYVDYHFENGKVFTLPSKLISIPCSRGRKALLIGGRDDKLINEMIKYCHLSKNKISLSVKKQNEKKLQLLIPDSILLESNNSGEFVNLANHFQIEFDEWYILKLKNFLPTLIKYEQFIINKGSSESWERFGLEKKVFKMDSLKFESVNEFDKEYALTEFRPSYIPEFGLWVNQSYYIVDKNWGKYLILNHYSEKVRGYGPENYFAKPVEIFCNANNLAIPASLPLPKLFSRIIMQLSGEVPDFKQMNLKGANVWYNVYRNVPSLFTENFFRFILNMIIETTTQKI